MSEGLTRVALAGSGAVLGLIGIAVMVSPKAFLETNGIAVDRDPGLMSELTAPAGVLIVTGVLMMLAAVRLRFANPGLTAGAIVYGSYGIGRLVSMGLHGMPSQSLVTATVIELGIAALLTVLRMRGAPGAHQQRGATRLEDLIV